MVLPSEGVVPSNTQKPGYNFSSEWEHLESVCSFMSCMLDILA